MTGRFTTATSVLLLTAALAAERAHGQASSSGGTELTLFGGYGFGGDFTTESGLVIDLDAGNDIGFIVDFEHDEETQWEFMYLEQRTSADTSDLSGFAPSTDTDIRLFHGGGTYRSSEGRVRPFAVGTAGLTRIETHGDDPDSDIFWSIAFGGGVQIYVSERVGFRLEGRILATLVDTSSSIWCGSNQGSGQCLFALQSEVVWQSHALAGITIRF